MLALTQLIDSKPLSIINHGTNLSSNNFHHDFQTVTVVIFKNIFFDGPWHQDKLQSAPILHNNMDSIYLKYPIISPNMPAKKTQQTSNLPSGKC